MEEDDDDDHGTGQASNNGHLFSSSSSPNVYGAPRLSNEDSYSTAHFNNGEHDSQVPVYLGHS